MAARLATEDGIAAYRQRGHIAETRTGTSSTTCASASYRSAASPKPPPNGHSPAQCTTCSRPSPPAPSPPPRWTTWPTRPPDRPAPLRQPRPGSHPGAARSHTRDTRPTRLPRHPHSARFSNSPLWIDHLFRFRRKLGAGEVLDRVGSTSKGGTGWRSAADPSNTASVHATQLPSSAPSVPYCLWRIQLTQEGAGTECSLVGRELWLPTEFAAFPESSAA